LYPICFAIVETESEATWNFFLENLLEGIPAINCPSILVISDREKGLGNAVATFVPEASHSFCSWHISRNIRPPISKENGKLLSKMSQSLRLSTFRRLFEILELSQPHAAAYLKEIPEETWVSCFCPVPRYGHTTSNLAETFNAWILKERQLSHFKLIMALLDRFSKLMRMRKDEYLACPQELPFRIQDRLDQILLKSHHFVARETTDMIYRIERDDDPTSMELVNLVNHSCSCGWFTEHQMPCEHGVAAINAAGMNPVDFLDKAYLTKSLRKAYYRNLCPVVLSDLNHRLLPAPVVRRARGRPQANRRMRAGEQVRYRCGYCKKAGHNKRRCPERPQTPHRQSEGSLVIPTSLLSSDRRRRSNIVVARTQASSLSLTPRTGSRLSFTATPIVTDSPASPTARRHVPNSFQERLLRLNQ